MTKMGTESGGGLHSEVKEEQIAALASGQMLSLPANCFIATITILLVWGSVAPWAIWCWYAGVLVTNGARLALSVCCLGPRPRWLPLSRLIGLQVGLAALSGLIWAVLPAAMLEDSNPSGPLAYFVIAGITAGASAYAGAFALVGHVFALPILGTVAVKYVLAGGIQHAIFAVTVSLFAAMITRASSNAQGSFTRAILLRTEAVALAESLKREHAASTLATQRLHHLANHDPLTGLCNRAAFAQALDGWLGRVGDDGLDAFFLFLIDLDHFKSVNDTLGHGSGDMVLKEVASRLTSAVGTTQIVARLGGDEFAILVADAGGPGGAAGRGDRGQALAEALIARVSGPFAIGERRLTIAMSLGFAAAPEYDSTAEGLLAHADLALYAAKDEGRHRARRFDATLLAAATMARDIEHDLEKALQGDGLEVWFQPQVAIATGATVGLEALLRWNHPAHGWIAPPAIVEAALRTRRSAELTGFIVDRAAAMASQLCSAGRDDIRVGVNVSPKEIGQYDVASLLRRAIARHGIDPRQLEVEITEEAFAASENGLAVMSELVAVGVRLAIDDFGAGYSSIAYLRSMPVDRIKIDRSFVTGLADRRKDQILVQAILGIGVSFGIEVVAEGVETADDVAALSAMNCRLAQGYHFGRPMPPQRLATWMAERDGGADAPGGTPSLLASHARAGGTLVAA